MSFENIIPMIPMFALGVFMICWTTYENYIKKDNKTFLTDGDLKNE